MMCCATQQHCRAAAQSRLQNPCSSIPNAVLVNGVCKCENPTFNVSALANTTLVACLNSAISSLSCPTAYPVPTRRGANGGIVSCSTAGSVCPVNALPLMNALGVPVECRSGAVACPAAYNVSALANQTLAGCLPTGISACPTVYPVSWKDSLNGVSSVIVVCATAGTTCPSPDVSAPGRRTTLVVYGAALDVVGCYLRASTCGATNEIDMIWLFNVSSAVTVGCRNQAAQSCPPGWSLISPLGLCTTRYDPRSPCLPNTPCVLPGSFNNNGTISPCPANAYCLGNSQSFFPPSTYLPAAVACPSNTPFSPPGSTSLNNCTAGPSPSP
jgi:hypothetical protein